MLIPVLRAPAAAIAVLVLCAPAFAADAAPARVRVELYVMSLCPFGVQAENELIPAVRSLGKSVDFNLDFIAGEVPAAGAYGSNASAFNSLHGPSEVEEDLRQVCMAKLQPKTYLDYILERDKSVSSPDWQAAASKAGGDAGKISACAAGAEGAALLSRSLKAASAREAGGSPTIYIAGKPYSGDRSRRAFTLAVCDALKASGARQPEACRQALALPSDAASNAPGGCGSPAAFNAWVVTDSSCAACAATLVDSIKRRHPGATVNAVDAGSEKGQALIAAHRPASLPLYVLDKDVEKEADFASKFGGFYEKSGGEYVIKPGPETYSPSVRLDRRREPGHMDVFVEALSPSAAHDMLELARVLGRSGGENTTLSVHYILQTAVDPGAEAAQPQPSAGGTRAASLKELKTVSTGELSSRRGETGVRESLREVCLFQHSSIGNYFSYLGCLAGRTDEGLAAACLKEDDAIKTCETGPEGRRILQADARLARELGITSDVALLWENRYGPFDWSDGVVESLLPKSVH